MQTLMRGSAEVSLSSTGEKIWGISVAGTIETKPIELSNSSYFSIFYKIDNASHILTIKIATGFEKDGEIYWTNFAPLEPNAVANFTGSTNWQHTEFIIPFCTHIKFQLSGTATSTYLVLALGKQ